MLTLPLHGLRPGPLTFSPDGRLLLLDSIAQWQVYDTATGERLWGPFRGAVPAFAADGRRVMDRWGSAFDLQTGKPVEADPPDDSPFDPAHVALWSPCGRWAVPDRLTALFDRTANRVVDLDMVLAPVVEERADRVTVSSVTPLAFSPDGDLLAGEYKTRLVVLRPAELAGASVTDRRPGRFGRSETVAVELVTSQKIYRGTVRAVVFTPDGRGLLVAGNTPVVRRWDTATWLGRPGYDFGTGPLAGVAVSPDGLRAAAAGTRKIVVWDLD